MNSMGFSLLELLVVIVIGAIIASIGIGGWQDIRLRNELSNTTLQLIRFFNEIKVDANSHNINHTIHLINSFPSSWCLAVTPIARPTDCQTSFRFIPNTQNIDILGLKIDSTLAFYGRRSTAQSGTVRLKNAIGESRIIISTRGRIRYCSYQTYLAGFPKC